jgi:hypothetical protein
VSTADQTSESHDDHVTYVRIELDRHIYRLDRLSMTGEELRHVPETPIGPDRDLYLEIHGMHDDELIERHQVVELKEGMRFFSAPSHINPGHAR